MVTGPTGMQLVHVDGPALSAGKHIIYCYKGETRDSHKRNTITKSGMGRHLERKRTRSVMRMSQVFIFPLARVDGPALSASVASW